MAHDLATALIDWARTADKDAEFTYYEGHLALARDGFAPELRTLSPIQVTRAKRVGDAAWQMYELGLVSLKQRREGPFRFDYIAKRTGRSYVEIMIKPVRKAEEPAPKMGRPRKAA